MKHAKVLNRCCKNTTEDIRGKIILGSILQQQPDLPAAADLYQEILRVDPKHLNARIQLAKILSQSGTIRQAIQLLEENLRTIRT